MFLRSRIKSDHKVELERNISHFGLEKSQFLKKEMDIILYKKHSVKSACIPVIELKALVMQDKARPISVFNMVKDLKFLEQLKHTGRFDCYFLLITDHRGYYSGSMNAGKLLSDISRQEIHGCYRANNESLYLSQKYHIIWKDVNATQKFFLLRI